jgi:uncharacterized protein YjbJ (UPF0337 family)
MRCTVRNLGGKVQEGVGRMTGDAATQAEGLMNQAAGTARDMYGQAKDATADVVQASKDAGDTLRRVIEERPLVAVAVALGVGWLLGRMDRRY